MADCQHWIEPMRAQEISELEAERNELVNNIRIAQAALTELRSIINHADAVLGSAAENSRDDFHTTYNAMALRQLGRMAGSPLAHELRQKQESLLRRQSQTHPLFFGLFDSSLT